MIEDSSFPTPGPLPSNEETKTVSKTLESSIETIELPEDEDKMASIEKVHGKIEGAAAQTQTSSVSQYCDQFIENYHFYCVGEILAEHAKFCNSFKKNCPEKVGSLKESGTFLGEKESHSSQHAPPSSLKPSEPSSEDVITTSSTRHQLYEFKGGKKEYCDKFSVNYEYFCNGGSTNVEITSKFCVSYKSACRSVVATTTQAPGNSDDFPDFDHPERTSSKRKNRKKKKKAYKRPCTADCDQRIYPHCTQSCKCDYAYPYVQKFCNPPPLPFFLNTCRLWYNGCPKYEQYHYASQFIYSKAEKGKVVEGPQGSKPFSILSPNGEQIPINQRIPNQIERVLWDGPLPLSDNEHEHVQGLVEWDLKGFDKKSEKTNLKGETLAVISPDKFEFDKKWFRDDPPPDPFEPEPRDGDAEKSKSNDSKDVKTTDKAKRDTPVVPSDSVFSNAVSQYGAFTDNRGLLHRPRSRSPFTKPGLWEPNPDNPHNRDHANKWYYHPQSVNVDWLNGQV